VPSDQCLHWGPAEGLGAAGTHEVCRGLITQVLLIKRLREIASGNGPQFETFPATLRSLMVHDHVFYIAKTGFVLAYRIILMMIVT
jgi:hypothetical protein